MLQESRFSFLRETKIDSSGMGRPPPTIVSFRLAMSFTPKSRCNPFPPISMQSGFSLLRLFRAIYSFGISGITKNQRAFLSY